MADFNYDTPMNNPAFRQGLLEHLQADAEKKRAQQEADPIMREIARRKALGYGPREAVGDVIEQSVSNPGLTGMGVFSSPSRGNPFADESRETQDLMRRLGVVR